MRRLLPPLALLCLVLFTAPAPPAGADGPWVPLGDLEVRDRVERDTLRVGADEGRFDAVQLRVKGRAVSSTTSRSTSKTARSPRCSCAR